MNLPVREFDAVVIGAGGAGMRAALQISQMGLSCALISKVFLLVLILFPLKEVSLLHLVIPMRTTGNGTCTIP